MRMSIIDLRSIAMAGGDLIVDATRMSVFDLRTLAMTAKTSNTHILVKNASSLSPLDCRSIAMAGGKNVVTFDITTD